MYTTCDGLQAAELNSSGHCAGFRLCNRFCWPSGGITCASGGGKLIQPLIDQDWTNQAACTHRPGEGL